MKHLILAAALLGATATTSLAQGSAWPAPPTAAQVQALKQDIVSKTADLQANIQANKTAKAEASAAALLKLMRQHVAETRNAAEATSGTQKTQLIQHMTNLENYVITFIHKSNNVTANSADLLTAANGFISNY